MSRRRTTCFVRVQLDYILRFDEQLDSLPSFVSPDAINRLIADGLKGLLTERVVPATEEELASMFIMPGARFSASLDFRKMPDCEEKSAAALPTFGPKSASKKKARTTSKKLRAGKAAKLK